jgi:DNA-nicking Smr family endonuclease
MTPPNDDFDEPKTEPIQTDQLDLHTFQPSECADVVEEFVCAAREGGYRIVRIIHGKGTGTLRRIVHSVLEKHPAVASFTLGDESSGSWGATIVELKTEADK